MSAWLESWSGLRLLDPGFLLLALGLPLGLWFRRRRRSAAIQFAPHELARALPGSWRTRTRSLPATLQALGVLLAIVALARPVNRDPLPLESAGIDILLCLDVSSSMAANDLDPEHSRLDVAKQAAAEFIAARADDRIGLLRFARYPDLVCPPTLDHAALRTLLAETAQVEPDGDEDLTGIGTAVARAAQALSHSAAKSRVAILLTDGVENVATGGKETEIAPLHAGQLCAELGVRVYTIVAGIGAPARDGAFLPLDPAQVRRLAEKTGGSFYEAHDASALADVYRTIDQLEKAELPQPRFRVDERFLPFLVASLLSWWLGRLLQSTVWSALP